MQLRRIIIIEFLKISSELLLDVQCTNQIVHIDYAEVNRKDKIS